MKEQKKATSQVSENMSNILQKRLSKKVKPWKGVSAIDETKEFNEMFNALH